MEPAAQHPVLAPFRAHTELLESFLAHRAAIVERVQELLNAQRKPPHYRQDAALLSSHFEDCFFAGGTLDQSSSRRQLEEAHWASGFRPRQTPGQHNDLIDPAVLMTRAFHLWQRTRWPGHHDRARYAHTLFNLYLLRRLMLLCMRVWDDGASPASNRLEQAQRILDQVWKTTPADQPVFVRDARWLFPLAQSPTTDELHGYFEVAQRIAETLSQEDRIEIQRASVCLAGGHLRSQLRHVSTQKRVSIDERSLVLSTRRSNALDLATLLQALARLLEAYEGAVQHGDDENRLKLADAICQGISPDPELFLNRLDLLGPYSMIEHLFIATDREHRVVYTPMGERHLEQLDAYAARIERVAKPLYEDCLRFRPSDGTYSPYGVLYGFSSQLLEHMGLKAVQREAVTRFSLEDVFVGGDAAKLAWVSGWRKLPHIPQEVAELFEYPQQFAEEVFRRIEDALCKRAAHGDTAPAVPNGQLFILSDDDQTIPSQARPDLPVDYVVSSDRQIVAEHKAQPYEELRLLRSRFEGEFLVSYRTTGGWVAITKDLLTDVLGAGRDGQIGGLPAEAARILKLMCPQMVASSRSWDRYISGRETG